MIILFRYIFPAIIILISIIIVYKKWETYLKMKIHFLKQGDDIGYFDKKIQEYKILSVTKNTNNILYCNQNIEIQKNQIIKNFENIYIFKNFEINIDIDEFKSNLLSKLDKIENLIAENAQNIKKEQKTIKLYINELTKKYIDITNAEIIDVHNNIYYMKIAIINNNKFLLTSSLYKETLETNLKKQIFEFKSNQENIYDFGLNKLFSIEAETYVGYINENEKFLCKIIENTDEEISFHKIFNKEHIFFINKKDKEIKHKKRKNYYLFENEGKLFTDIVEFLKYS